MKDLCICVDSSPTTDAHRYETLKQLCVLVANFSACNAVCRSARTFLGKSFVEGKASRGMSAQGGGVLGRRFQPHEAHIPYLLQLKVWQPLSCLPSGCTASD